MTAGTEVDLEALVRDELRGPVSELVKRLVPELVAEAMNGSEAGTQQGPSLPLTTEAPTTKTCKVCGETKPASEFDRHRHTCKRCRRAQERERVARRQAPDDEEPHPAAGSQDGHKSQRRLDSDRFWKERRRALIDEARRNGVTHELRDGREFTVLHLAPQFAPPMAGA